MHSPSCIIITGATSGIGAALAREYAAPGVTLGLLGRSGPRMQEVAEQCRQRGAHVETGLIDVRDAAAMEAFLLDFDTRQPVELLIANAGISAGSGEEGEPAAQVRALFAVNMDGVLNSVLPLSARMQGRGRGQIAVMSSLAGIRALPSCPAYSASKAAVRYFGEALGGSLKGTGVYVSVICPGYIRTPMSDANDFPMPFIMSAEKSARIIRRGLARRRPRLAFPLALYLPLWLLSCLPVMLTNPLFAALPRKATAKGTARNPFST